MNNSTAPSFIYAITADELPFVKIGFSGQPLARLQELQTASPYKLNLVRLWQGTWEQEQELHVRLSLFHQRGEWYKITDYGLIDASLGTPLDLDIVLPKQMRKPNKQVRNPGSTFTWSRPARCGCRLPQWKGIEWRNGESGHYFLQYIGTAISCSGKRVKRREYGRFYSHRAAQLFMENEGGVLPCPAQQDDGRGDPASS